MRPSRTRETPRQRKRRLAIEEHKRLERWAERQERHQRLQAEEERRRADAQDRCLPQVEVDKILAAMKAPRPERPGRRGGKRPKVKDKDLDRYAALAWAAGWRMEFGGLEHLKVFAPEGEIISIPSTPSKQRTVRRIRSAFRRNGLEV